MDDSQPGPRARERAGRAGAEDDTVTRAEQLFSSFIGEGAQRRGSAAQAPEDGPRANPAAKTPVAAAPPPAAPAPAVNQHDRDVAAAALAATDRIAEVVDLVGSQVDASAADLTKLGRAVEEALQATNERLAALERIVLGEVGPGGTEAAQPVERAMSRLRRTVRRLGGGPTGR